MECGSGTCVNGKVITGRVHIGRGPGSAPALKLN